MASISPTSCQCDPEKGSGKKAYLKFEVTDIRDSDATTNKRYIDWKVTFQGTPYSYFYAAEIVIAGDTVYNKKTTSAIKTSWKVGDVLCSGTQTIDNDSAGNLSFNVSLHQMFYYGYSDSRWWNTTYSQWTECKFTCSQLKRFANFTKHEISSTGINKIGITFSVDATCDSYQYSLNSGSWKTASGTTYYISDLSPNTSYTVKTRVKRSDSQLWSESGTLSPKTASLPTTNTPGDINIGNNPTASISSISNLDHWWYEVYDGSTKLGTSSNLKSTSGSCTINDGSKTTSMLGRHSSGNDWTLTYKFYCKSNETQYTLTERTAKCIIPTGSYLPTYNSNNTSYAVTDTTSLNITGSNQKVIKGISDITYTFTAATPNGSATMSSYIVKSGTKTSPSVSAASSMTTSLSDIDGNSYTIQAIDSRGRSTTVSKSYSTYIDYSKPTVTITNIVRKDGISKNVIFKFSGVFTNWSGLQVNNTIVSIKFKYKEKSSSSWSSETTMSGITFSGNTYSVDYTSTGDKFDTTKEYDVQINITDKLSTYSYNLSIPVGKALLWRDMANNRIGINKKPDYALDVNGDINTTGQFRKNKAGGWINDRDNASVRNNNNGTSDGYAPVVSQKTKNGNWTIGAYQNDCLIFNYTKDSDYSGTNQGTVWRLPIRGTNYNAVDNLALLCYPVGAIYISISPTNPGTIFGGTWSQLKNAYLFATNATSGDKGTGSGTGTGTGAASGNTGSTTLTVDQIPSHTHKATYSASAVGTGWESYRTGNSTTKGANDYLVAPTGGGKGHTHTLNSHTHTVPYLEVYVWKRTA